MNLGLQPKEYDKKLFYDKHLILHILCLAECTILTYLLTYYHDLIPLENIVQKTPIRIFTFIVVAIGIFLGFNIVQIVRQYLELPSSWIEGPYIINDRERKMQVPKVQEGKQFIDDQLEDVEVSQHTSLSEKPPRHKRKSRLARLRRRASKVRRKTKLELLSEKPERVEGEVWQSDKPRKKKKKGGD